MTGRTWTISNLLSISRIILVIPIVLLLLGKSETDRWWAAGIMVVTVLTDIFDGILARRLNQVTDLGKILDPLSDKIGIAIVLVVLMIQGFIPLWFLFTVFLQDILILSGGTYAKKQKNIILQSNLFGKLTVVAIAAYILFTTVGLSQLKSIETVLRYVSVLMIIASFAVYARRFYRVLREEH